MFRRMDRSEVPAVWTGHGIGWSDEAVEETDRQTWIVLKL